MLERLLVTYDADEKFFGTGGPGVGDTAMEDRCIVGAGARLDDCWKYVEFLIGEI